MRGCGTQSSDYADPPRGPGACECVIIILILANQGSLGTQVPIEAP